MTMPDPNAAIRPSELPGDEAATGQEPTHGALTPQEERPIEAQTANDCRPSESEPASPTDASPALQAENERQASAKPPALQSFSDLLRATYGASSKRPSPKKTEIAAMRSAPKLEPSEREELLALVASDRTLEMTRAEQAQKGALSLRANVADQRDLSLVPGELLYEYNWHYFDSRCEPPAIQNHERLYYQLCAGCGRASNDPLCKCSSKPSNAYLAPGGGRNYR